MKTSHEAIANNVKRLMIERQLTQTQLANKVGVSQKTISNMINSGSVGSITTESIEKVARFFRIEPYHLMIPDLPVDELTNTTIEKIITYYAHSTKESRLNIARVAELESRYSVI
jgi:DNA-binding Xre family transcriptional regulator